MAECVCVNLAICPNANPRATYVYVRVTQRDGESERCAALSPPNSSSSIIIKKVFLELENREEEGSGCGFSSRRPHLCYHPVIISIIKRIHFLETCPRPHQSRAQL